MRSKKLLFGSGLLLCLGGALAYTLLVKKEPPGIGTRQAISDRTNVIIISLDTLRADRLGVYGYTRNTSPQIDALAGRGVTFTKAVAESSWTLPSHTTMLTGLHPATHGVLDKQNRLGPRWKFLSEILRVNGYDTLGFVDGGYVSSSFGFARGFDVFNDDKRGFADRIQQSLQALDSRADHSRPFFLFLHTYDAHCPYAPPEPYFSKYSSQHSEVTEVRGRCGDAFLRKEKPTPSQVQYISDRYDGGIRWVDDNLRTFIDALTDRDLLTNSLIVLTSDHGESFMEHGRIGHQASLHNELLHIPLIMTGPGIPARTTALRAVGLMNIAPTILDYLGIKPAHRLDGRSLLPLILPGREGPLPERSRVSMLRRKTDLTSLVRHPYQLIRDEKSGEIELYNLDEDPRSQNNLAERYQEDLERLRKKMDARLVKFERALKQKNPSPANAEVSKERIRQLETLGYM